MTKRKGFTLLEIVVSMSIFVLAVLLTGSVYSISQKSYIAGSDRAELTQNARVVMDRMSREIRQAVDIITVLPATNDDIMNPAPSEIMFRDGHDINETTYVKYYLNNNNFYRKHTAYYFAEEPGTYVSWNSVDQNGNPPEEIILEDRITGEFFNSLNFWGADGLVHIAITLNKNKATVVVETSVFTRN